MNVGIILSGVHGVGKGFFLEKNKVYLSDYIIYSASSLIGEHHEAADAGFKRVVSVKDNQQIFINTIKEKQEKNPGDYIIDGHLCLFNKDYEIERISEAIIDELNISGILLIQDEPERIYKRILRRDSDSIDLEQIKLMQDGETEYAAELASKYNIKTYILSPDCDIETVIDYLSAIRSGSIE